MQRRTLRNRQSLVAGAAVAAVCGLTAVGHATVIDWRSDAPTTIWATATNWVGGTAPASSAADTARFNQTSYLNEPNVNASRTVGSIVVGDGTTATAALTISGSATLAIGSGGSGGGVTLNANAGAVEISAPTSLGANQTWANNSANLLTVSGNLNLVNRGLIVGGSGNALISGAISATSGTLTKNDGGTLTLSSAANSYAGLTTVNAGSLKLGALNAITAGNPLTTAGTGTFDLNGFSETLAKLTNGTAVTNSSATAATLTIGNASTGTGSFSGKMDVIFNQGTNNSGPSGTFTNTGNLTFTAASTGTLLAGGTYNNVGGIVLNASTATISASGTFGNTGDVTLNSTAAITASGSFANTGNLILNANGTNAITMTTNPVNNTGTIVNSGTSSGLTTIAVVGANAALNAQNSNGSLGGQPIFVAAGTGTRTISSSGPTNANFSGAVTLNHDLVIENDAASSLGMTLSGGMIGTGNLIINGDSTTEGTMLSTQANGSATPFDIDPTKPLNITGTITNSGTGTQTTIIRSNIGSNVQGVVQNSATSPLVLDGTNTYGGSTSVMAGSLQLGETITLMDNSTVAFNASLSQGNISVLGGAQFVADNVSTVTFNVQNPSTFDKITNAGTATLNGALLFNFNSALADGTAIDLFTGAGAYASNLTSVTGTGAYAGAFAQSGSVFSQNFGGQELTFDAATGDLTVTAVPEPASLTLIGGAALAMLWRCRRASHLAV
jgi:autotransporter-associated beta strand protein